MIQLDWFYPTQGGFEPPDWPPCGQYLVGAMAHSLPKMLKSGYPGYPGVQPLDAPARMWCLWGAPLPLIGKVWPLARTSFRAHPGDFSVLGLRFPVVSGSSQPVAYGISILISILISMNIPKFHLCLPLSGSDFPMPTAAAEVASRRVPWFRIHRWHGQRVLFPDLWHLWPI
jgi:hypothetical protein